MNVVFITSEFPYNDSDHGGIGSFLKTFSICLKERNLGVTIIYFNNKESKEVDINGVNLILVKYSPIRGLAWLINFWRLNRIISKEHKRRPISIIEGAEMSFSFIKKIPNVKYLIRLHGGHHFFSFAENREVNLWKGFQEKISFRRANAFIGVSEFSVNETSKHLNFRNKPLRVINYPISFSQFYPRPKIKISPYSLAFAGTICEKKGVRQLLQALSLLVKEFPDIHLNLYGRDWIYPNGVSYIKEMKETFKSISSFFTFHGVVGYEELPIKYAKSEICIFPSHFETQGLVAPESMAMEKPVIFTKIGPGPETITHGLDGWLCDPLDPEDIYIKVKNAFQRRSDFEQIGKNARQKVLEKFSPNTIVDSNIDFYKYLISLK